MVLCGAGAGYLQSHKLSLRVRFLEQYLQFLNYLQTQIRFSSSTTVQLIEAYTHKQDKLAFLSDCAELAERGDSFPQAWKTAVNQIPSTLGLKQEDQELLLDFGQNFGTSDVEGQLSYCSLQFSMAQGLLEDAKGEKQKKQRLYMMLGVTSGTSLALLVC